MKFQQGFVAAAHQVQSFLMATPLEPSVSSRLLSHLSSYATTITPPPGASPPAANPSSPPHPVAPVPSRPQPTHSQHQQTLQIPKSCSPSQHPHNTYNPPVQRSLTPPQQPPTSVRQSPHPYPPTSNSYPLPLMDLSNHQSLFVSPTSLSVSSTTTSSNFSSPALIREVSVEDRMVAPSPFIDVVSTSECEDVKPIQIPSKTFFTKPTPHSHNLPQNFDHKDIKNITLQLQARVVASESRSPSHGSVRHHPYPHKKFSNPRNNVCSSPVPEDLSMKKDSTDDNQNSWRPWSESTQ